MSIGDAGGFTAPTEQIYGNLSYEQILARAVDRCLHYRVIAKNTLYIDAVQSLHLSLVDIPGKPLRTKVDAEEEIIRAMDGTMVVKSDKLFRIITKTLSEYKMLFRSILVETGREQVYH